MLASVEAEEAKDEAIQEAPLSSHPIPDDLLIPVISDTMSCVTCSAPLTTRSEQIEHYKSDWHRFNLKSKLRGSAVVSEEQFEDITGDISSISGSDSEETHQTTSRFDDDDDDDDESYHIEGEGRRHPRVFLRNDCQELISLYRCLLYSKKNAPETQSDLLQLVKNLPSQRTWCLLMMSGGHFAAAIFEGDEVIAHKTFHRYVVRAKRGTVQSARDQKGNAPKSGGATLRRYNEAALNQDILDLMKEWKESVAKCSHIFLRVPTFNRPVLFQGKTPCLDKKDPRLRNVPFQTRRPTFREVKRTHSLLASMYCHGEGGGKKRNLIKRKKNKSQQEKRKRNRQRKGILSGPKLIEVRNELFTACKIGDAKRFHSALEAASADLDMPVDDLINEPLGPHKTTLLHVASKANNGDLVCDLLRLGCDPTLRTSTGQYPYQLANKRLRVHFKTFAAEHPEKYNYLKAQIPIPIPAEEMNEKKEREAEKRRMQRKAKKMRIKEETELRKKEEKEQEERNRYLNLSDREKRALAAERRILAQKSDAGQSTPVLSRCWFCAEDMTGKIPFEYYDYKFCSPKCLKEHKIKNK
ncbi:hypothetical protein CAPTEDRAFT_99754 [Capitella teleta]|uniref:VLRF1 domain-containing protein n=1 Tax=Capitella teleta TaxID=283909 RepID=R7UWS3_CAPTE|nr:hypothetical protein CAPTEDRAFT_99754 [Capitella teleta]|eukprot:ELU10697.1 hypothetical protein CAPTEDRAFT_99754 [Capitella teleta]